MSLTSYQTAPPRVTILCRISRAEKWGPLFLEKLCSYIAGLVPVCVQGAVLINSLEVCEVTILACDEIDALVVKIAATKRAAEPAHYLDIAAALHIVRAGLRGA